LPDKDHYLEGRADEKTLICLALPLLLSREVRASVDYAAKDAMKAIHEESISKLLMAQPMVTWVETIITSRVETIERGETG
jgi:hypothetical protein